MSEQVELKRCECPFCGKFPNPDWLNYCPTCINEDGMVLNWFSRPIEDGLRKRIAELEWFMLSHFDTQDINEAIHNMYE